MPVLQRLTEEGSRGNLATIQPVLSPMLWTSIATGKRAWKHGIHGFSEPVPNMGGIRPISSLSRKTKAIWNIFNQEGLRSHVIGWWPSHPAEPINGVMISNHYQQASRNLSEDWPMRPGTVHPEELAEALKEFRVHPAELRNEHVLPFIPKAAEIDQDKDTSMKDCMKILAENAGIHAAATAVMQREPWDFMAVYYDGIDHFGHRFMHYHPPRLPWVPIEDFEKYKDVIEGAYRYHDMMLDALLRLAGDDTTVILISDHGFEPGNLRSRSIPNEPAGPAAEHSPLGIFCARGPGIRKNHEIHGACLLDIAPTLLHMKGLAVGEDMDGRVLRDIFESEPADVVSIPSWDAVPGESGQHPADSESGDPSESREEIRQLVELGYIDEPDADIGKAIDDTLCELNYNLAQAYMDGGRFTDAVRILQKEWDRNPRKGRFGTKLLLCYLSLRDPVLARDTFERMVSRKEEAMRLAAVELEELMESLKAEGKDGAEAESSKKIDRKDQQTLRRLRGQVEPNPKAFAFFRGCLLILEDNLTEALVAFKECEEAEESLKPSLYNKMGEVYLKLEDWDAAEETYRKTLSISPLDSDAHLGMAQIFTARKLPFDAAAAALKSLEINFAHPRAQFLYGQALRNLGKPAMARKALQHAVDQSPDFVAAWRELAGLYKEGSKKAVYYKEQAGAAEKRLMERTRKLHKPELRPIKWANFPNIIEKSESSGKDPLIIVSGLPRSGTSLMMQMLEAAGVPIVSDGTRKANESNSKGYFEDERVKRLATGGDPEWLTGCRGQAIKIVLPVITHAPMDLPQKIIFMERPAEEVVRSQRAMLKRDGKIGSTSEDDRLSEIFADYLKNFNDYARSRDAIAVLPIHYHDVLNDPETVARKVAAFVKPDADIREMIRIVDPKLYRTRPHEDETLASC